MAEKLQNKKVAILVAEQFEQVEMTEPRRALQEAGAETVLIAPESGSIRAWNEDDWGDEFDVDQALDQANESDFDALLLPGGVNSPDTLRTNERALKFVHHFFESGKPVASLCHGPWTLINAGVVNGRTMTSSPAIQVDLKNAGANWLDQEVVTDMGLVTSRGPQDLEAFNRKMIEEIGEGIHSEQRKSA